MDPEIQRQLLEIGAFVVGLIVISGLVAFVLVQTAAFRKERRRRKVSASSRAKNTSYNLFEARNPDEAKRHGSKRKGRHRSSRPHQVIDILQRDLDGEAPAEIPTKKP